MIVESDLEMTSNPRFISGARLEVKDPSILKLLFETLSRIPPEVLPILTVKEIRLRRKGSMRGLVGLTWCGVRFGKSAAGITQTITFYTDLFYRAV